jgi:hypothetical protein
MNPPFHLVFCGTPAFSVPTLEALVKAGFSVDLVVTRPDKPKGRGMEMAVNPVKQAALALHLPIAQPETIKNNADFRAQLQSLNPEAIVVVGYGRIARAIVDAKRAIDQDDTVGLQCFRRTDDAVGNVAQYGVRIALFGIAKAASAGGSDDDAHRPQMADAELRDIDRLGVRRAQGQRPRLPGDAAIDAKRRQAMGALAAE